MKSQRFGLRYTISDPPTVLAIKALSGWQRVFPYRVYCKQQVLKINFTICQSDISTCFDKYRKLCHFAPIRCHFNKSYLYNLNPSKLAQVTPHPPFGEKNKSSFVLVFENPEMKGKTWFRFLKCKRFAINCRSIGNSYASNVTQNVFLRAEPLWNERNV